MTAMAVLSLAYEGGGVSAQQHLALHPLRPPLLHPSSLFFQWSQRTERKPLLRSPDRRRTSPPPCWDSLCYCQLWKMRQCDSSRWLLQCCQPEEE